MDPSWKQKESIRKNIKRDIKWEKRLYHYEYYQSKSAVQIILLAVGTHHVFSFKIKIIVDPWSAGAVGAVTVDRGGGGGSSSAPAVEPPGRVNAAQCQLCPWTNSRSPTRTWRQGSWGLHQRWPGSGWIVVDNSWDAARPSSLLSPAPPEKAALM